MDTIHSSPKFFPDLPAPTPLTFAFCLLYSYYSYEAASPQYSPVVEKIKNYFFPHGAQARQDLTALAEGITSNAPAVGLGVVGAAGVGYAGMTTFAHLINLEG